jgi:predicted TIM-barrel fold metal-dependent hydrolase
MVNEREAWLNLTVEEPIEPDLPICDPHHHMWRNTSLNNPFQQYLLSDLLKDTESGHNIVRTVFVECSAEYREDGPEELKPVGETGFVQAVGEEADGAQHGKIAVNAGIVGYANLALGDAVTPVLEAHIEAGKGRFRGIRHASAWDASPEIGGYKNPPKGLLADSKFREGFAQLEKHGLSYDAWMYHPQLMELADLAKAFPNVTIILDHIGGPLCAGPYAGKRDEIFQQWKQGIAALAEHPNIVVKVGGCGMANYGFGWHERETPPGSQELAEATAPYYLWCIEQFGPGSCMFESNFPVDKVSYSYNVMWNSFKLVSKNFSPDERAALFHDTAAKTYRIMP